MRVAIVGGGAAGTFAALAIRDQIPNAQLTIFDPSEAMPRGIAYSFRQSWLRLNVPASKMGGGLERNSTGFADWLMQEHQLPPSSYVTRFIFGDYLTDLIGELIIGGHCEIERGEVTSICPLQGRGYRVATNEKSLDADAVILCTGHLPPNNFLKAHERIVPDAWAPGALDAIEPEDKLLVIGTGATAVDVVLTLQRASHRGLITMISPHGHLPLVDAEEAPYPEFFKLDDSDLRPLSLLRRLRVEAENAKRTGAVWQNVVDSFRYSVCAIWQEWSPRERKQFIRHCSQMWLIHRHRLPPDVAALMNSFVEAGRLEIRRARYKSLQEVQGGFGVELATRGASVQVSVNRILNTTGPSLAFRQAKAPLYRQLFADKMARSDELGLGLQVDDGAQLLDETGRAQRGLYVLGSATRGHFWEVTAAPDIRLQASRLAEHVRKSQTENGDQEKAYSRRTGRTAAE